MTVKAKFRCSSIIDTKNPHGYSNRVVIFSAVYSDSGENKDYAKATPWGELKMQIDESTPAYDAFKPGNDYYLTFEEA